MGKVSEEALLADRSLMVGKTVVFPLARMNGSQPIKKHPFQRISVVRPADSWEKSGAASFASGENVVMIRK